MKHEPGARSSAWLSPILAQCSPPHNDSDQGSHSQQTVVAILLLYNEDPVTLGLENIRVIAEIFDHSPWSSMP